MGIISPFYVILGNQIRNDWSFLWKFRVTYLYFILLRIVNKRSMWCRFYAAVFKKMKLLYKPTNLSCEFIISDFAKSEGVQKVIGFSRGWHNWNSIRLGIRKEENYCVLYFYAYIKGQRIIQRLGRYQIGELVKCRLHWGYYIECKANDGYAFRVAPKCSFPIGYLLYPYAEKDGVEGVQVPLNIEINNLKII
jgi:hypothetical protein